MESQASRLHPVQRVNSRIDQGLGFDHHTIRGLTKMRTRMGLGLAVMLAIAVGFISEDKPALMRSLVGNTPAVRVEAFFGRSGASVTLGPPPSWSGGAPERVQRNDLFPGLRGAYCKRPVSS